jgi:hypothetical protein
MSSACIEPADYESVARLPGDDPRRRHLEECPRCGAVWKAYRSFLEDREPLDGERPDEANATLGRIIEQQFGVTGIAPGTDPSSPGATEPRPARRPAHRFFRSPWRIGALILAPAAAVLAAVLLFSHGSRPGAPQAPYRGETAPAAFELRPSEVLPDGRIHLSWTPLDGADAYEVRIYDRRLGVLLKQAAGAQTALDLAPATLGPVAAPGAHFAWRVVASRAGEEVGTSAAGALEIPAPDGR